MPAFNVTIDNRTFSVDIPGLIVRPLAANQDDKALEIKLASAEAAALREFLGGNRAASGTSSGTTTDKKPVMALWHATIREE